MTILPKKPDCFCAASVFLDWPQVDTGVAALPWVLEQHELWEVVCAALPWVLEQHEPWEVVGAALPWVLEQHEPWEAVGVALHWVLEQHEPWEVVGAGVSGAALVEQQADFSVTCAGA